MRIALIADTFPPLRNSGAVQLRDLSREFARQGHDLMVLLPDHNLQCAYYLEEREGYNILRLRAPKTKDVNYIRRTLAEFLMPFFMRWNLKNSNIKDIKWDGVLWYSPSIFHGPLVSYIKKKSNCPAYLIIRDIFPEWAVDMGLMGKGLPYRFFSTIADYQYSVADVIGVQTPGNIKYFQAKGFLREKKIDVLNNWLDKPSNLLCSIQLNKTKLKDRKIFVYAGNMGVAQGMDIFIELATRLVSRSDIGFLFVGRGSEAERLKKVVNTRALDNTLFFEEIDPDEIPNLYSQCHVGLVALDPRHKSHNIPGKFLTYMQSGLAVLANVNAGNDLVNIIRDNKVGCVCESNDLNELEGLALEVVHAIDGDADLKDRCLQLFSKYFSVEKIVKQIVGELEEKCKSSVRIS